MRNAGIFAPEDIGLWIKEVLARNIQQKDLSNKLGEFLKSKYINASSHTKISMSLL